MIHDGILVKNYWPGSRIAISLDIGGFQSMLF